VDDGARTLDESIAIARQFLSEGVEVVAATPHLDPLNGRGIAAPEVRERVQSLQQALEDARVPLSVRAGTELFLTPDAAVIVAEDRACCLGDSPYVLVEVSLRESSRPLYLDDAIFRLQLKGYCPILAHPERYGWVQRDPAALDGLLERGLLLQLTAPALLGEYGRKIQQTSETLLARNAYALAASDRHHPGATRSLADTYRRIEQLCGEQAAALVLSANPRRVIEGEVPEPVTSVRTGAEGGSRWSRFFHRGS
jgi:protein-tyrosine phosphatase